MKKGYLLTPLAFVFALALIISYFLFFTLAFRAHGDTIEARIEAVSAEQDAEELMTRLLTLQTSYGEPLLVSISRDDPRAGNELNIAVDHFFGKGAGYTFTYGTTKYSRQGQTPKQSGRILVPLYSNSGALQTMELVIG